MTSPCRNCGSDTHGACFQPWTAQVNDVIGGWIVTRFPAPLSKHPFYNDPTPQRRNDIVIAECMSESDAKLVAGALNEYEQALAG